MPFLERRNQKSISTSIEHFVFVKGASASVSAQLLMALCTRMHKGI